MRTLRALGLAAALTLGGGLASAQELIDKGMVHGWNLMVDPQFGDGCLIQTVYQDLSVVRLGYDMIGGRGYLTIFNQAWGDIENGKEYPVTFDMDGEKFDAVATGIKDGKVSAAILFFDDRNFVNAIAQRKVMTVFGQDGQEVMAIDLKGTSKAIEYARQCQNEMTGGG